MSSASAATNPVSGFAAFGFGATLTRGIADMGFTSPRPIQEAAIPAVLAGRDVLGLAQTGTGKTAAFGLPIMERLLRERRSGPRALIVAPTRELAAQIDAELRALGRYAPLRTAVIFGGVGMRPQIDALRRGVDIIVACPGRLLDHLNEGHVKLDRIETLVLDEADHMFDMGFLPDVRRILRACPQNRQNLMFSATMPAEIRRLANEVLRNPHVVELAHTRPAETIEHALYPIDESLKIDALFHLLSRAEYRSAIVFTRTKHRAKRLADKLAKGGHRAVALQGNMSQSAREVAMRGFRDGRFDVLVATDIAARGIDVAQVSHVINFDTPNTPEAYTHRIGRTGRSEQSGQAFTFVTRDDHDIVRAIERKLGHGLERRQIDGFAGRLAAAPAASHGEIGAHPLTLRGRDGHDDGDRAGRRPRRRGGRGRGPGANARSHAGSGPARN